MIDFNAKPNKNPFILRDRLSVRDFNKPDVIALFDSFGAEIERLHGKADTYVVITENDYLVAQESLSYAKHLNKKIEEKRKEIKAPYLKFTKFLDGKVKNLTQALDSVCNTITEKMKPYALSMAESKMETESMTSKVEEKWTWELKSFADLPIDILEERREQIIKAIAPAVNARIKAGIRKIPGVNIYQEEVLKTRIK